MKRLIFPIVASVILLSSIIAMCCVGCTRQDPVSDEIKTYDITSEIHSLHVSINAADFVIRYGDAFFVESNLKYLSLSENSGVLKIKDEARNGKNYSNAILNIYIPKNTVFEDVNVSAGASKLTSDELSTKTLELELGAGEVNFKKLHVFDEAEIEGGAGQVNVLDGAINALDLKMGMGEFNLKAALTGDCELEFGVGESNLVLIGKMEDYTVNIEKGIGAITVNGKETSDFGCSGSGNNRIEIEGGVGAINLLFQEN